MQSREQVWWALRWLFVLAAVVVGACSDTHQAGESAPVAVVVRLLAVRPTVVPVP